MRAAHATFCAGTEADIGATVDSAKACLESAATAPPSHLSFVERPELTTHTAPAPRRFYAIAVRLALQFTRSQCSTTLGKCTQARVVCGRGGALRQQASTPSTAFRPRNFLFLPPTPFSFLPSAKLLNSFNAYGATPLSSRGSRGPEHTCSTCGCHGAGAKRASYPHPPNARQTLPLARHNGAWARSVQTRTNPHQVCKRLFTRHPDTGVPPLP